MKLITVPDIGDFKNVPVIEILVQIGDRVTENQPLVVVESDKATMEIPSAASGLVLSIDVKIGDKLNRGQPLVTLQVDADTDATPTPDPVAAAPAVPGPPAAPEVTTVAAPAGAPSAASAPPASELPTATATSTESVYAGPAVRKLARQLGVDLTRVKGSGPRGRIVIEDVHASVKSVMGAADSAASTAAGAGLPFNLLPWPKVDFAQFGPVDSQPLSRIRKISGANLHRNWVSIPHVTNHDDADITELEAFRAELSRELEKESLKISPLAFILKACVATLKVFPEFNASLDGETLVLKRYWHIGFAADTPNGLVVPVIRDADQKGLIEIAREMRDLSAKARAGKLSSADMQGGTFSISSLGGIGGSYFTPIINAPEVAILGVGKTQTRVVWQNNQATPRLYLPLSLSWDHRVVDGASAGRFNAYLVRVLGDVRRLLL